MLVFPMIGPGLILVAVRNNTNSCFISRAGARAPSERLPTQSHGPLRDPLRYKGYPLWMGVIRKKSKEGDPHSRIAYLAEGTERIATRNVGVQR